MELIAFNEYIKKDFFPELIATIGDFDGIHLAHKTLLNQTVEIAHDKKLKSAIITFDPHPTTLLANDNQNFQLNSLSDKYNLVKMWNIDYLIVISFSHEFSKIMATDFLLNYLLRINVKEVVVGFDFKFGYKGKGTAQQIESLSNHQIKANIIPEIKFNNEKIGSSKIRNLLREGNLNLANQLLGYHYFFSGIVMTGNHVGSTINLPTANIKVDKNFIALKKGVYAVTVYYQDYKFYGMMNVGHNPSFNYSKEISIEVHIFDFNEDIYGKLLKIVCHKFIRNEIKFSSIDDFLKQIKKDKSIIKNYFQLEY